MTRLRRTNHWPERLGVLLLGAGFVVSLAAPMIARAEATIGKAAPDFSLPASQDGKTVSLKPLVAKSKATLLLFIAVRCPYSNGYNERMAILSRDYAKRDVAILGINSNKTEAAEDVARHAQKFGLTFPVLKDTNSKVADLYGAQHTPEAYLIDGKGTLVYHGRIDENYEDAKQVKSPDLRNAVDAVLAGKSVETATTKAFGCSIKR